MLTREHEVLSVSGLRFLGQRKRSYRWKYEIDGTLLLSAEVTADR